MNNLKWVTTQGCAVLLGKYKRTHYILNILERISESPIFMKYKSKMLSYI